MMYGWIIGIIIVIVLIAALGKGRVFQRNTDIADTSANPSAMQILKNRYAKGEIDEAEFEKKKAELEKAD